MDIGLTLLLILGVAFALQIIASMLQIKYFTKQFVALRKKGKVAVGRQGGGFFAGAIVMFLIDDDGIIKEGKKMEGLTCFARVKDFEGYEGRYVGDLSAEDGPDGHKNLKRAIEDAANNYNMIKSGGQVPPKPSPYKKAGNFLARVFSGKKANEEYKQAKKDLKKTEQNSENKTTENSENKTTENSENKTTENSENKTSEKGE